jgi:hypothetical protein
MYIDFDFLHFSRSNQDFSVFKGFSSALESEFQIPGVFKEFKEWHEPCLSMTLNLHCTLNYYENGLWPNL